MRCFFLIIGLAFVASSPVFSSGGYGDLLGDAWAATDGLDRALPTRAICGPAREGRFVGIFYFLWLGQHGTGGPYDITKLLAANPTNPAWGPVNAFHHWGESEAGYYLSSDPWVIRRHCHMLVDAGVDTLIFDVTNAFTYTSNYQLVCSVYSQIRSEGGKTPQICFLANSSSDLVVQKLYDEFYSQNLYPELWFRWQGKPLMLANPDNLNETLRAFFTFRQSWAWSGTTWFGNGCSKWPWLDSYPQAYGWIEPGIPEEVPVCVAQHPTSNIGRSFHAGAQPAPENLQTAVGPCFAEQGERALQVDPQFMFITGWNEWVAQRFLSDGSDKFLGHTLPAGETYFVDTCSQEYSRDIEPMKGGHTDNYYYQMVSLIRRYKGLRAPTPPSAPKTIGIDASFADWTDVQPDYWDTPYDTNVRNQPGWGSAGTYVNNTGRNDFVHLKVTHNADYIYFYAETRASISSRSGANWMLLYIDADHNHATGWEGYDFLVNGSVVGSSTTTLKSHNTSGYNWTQVANVGYRYSGNKMEIALPRSSLGLTGSDLLFDFHWADNLQVPGDVISFCTYGDSAPNRRFNYRFNTCEGAPAPVAGLAATHTARSVSLQWNHSASIDQARTVIRWNTAGFPASPSDGIGLVDVCAATGALGEFVHAGLATSTSYYYSAFACDVDGNWSAPATISVRLVPGDFDHDGDVDQSDYGWFQACVVGEVNPVPLGCEDADLDADHDVDQADLRLMQPCVAGADLPPGC